MDYLLTYFHMLFVFVGDSTEGTTQYVSFARSRSQDVDADDTSVLSSPTVGIYYTSTIDFT
jgi:hypothetical protein